MQFLRSLFTGGQKVVVADLAEPYRDLMQTQTLPVVRGVLVHAIAAMEGLQNPSAPNCVLFGDTFSKKLAAIQQEQVTYTPNDTAFSAMAMAVAYIVLRSAPKIIVGEDMVIRNLSGAEEIKRAAMCYAFSLFIYLTFLTAFMDAGLVSKDCES